MAGKLTSTAIKNVKAKSKPHKLADGGGMYLLVNRSGKYWRMDYRYAGKRKTLALGVYPEISLKEARKRRDMAKEQLANGLDPQAEKQIRKHEKTLAANNTFEAIAKEIATGRAERDPSQNLRGALEPVVVTHHASITNPAEIGALLRAIDGYTGSFIAQCALKLAPLVFVRPGELRQAAG